MRKHSPLPILAELVNSGITIGSVKLYDSANPYDNIQSGTLTFSDRSSIYVGALDNAGDPTTVTFPAKSGITWMKFQVDSSNSGWLNNGLSEIEVFCESIGGTVSKFLYLITVIWHKKKPLQWQSGFFL